MKQIFKKGVKVTWKSKSGGHSRKQAGVIITTVEPWGYPMLKIPKGYKEAYRFGAPRSNKSFLIAIGKKVYWPLVKRLEVVED